jgi:hypothetical protein
LSTLYGPEIKDHLLDALASLPGWARTEDLVQALDERAAWGDLERHALILAKKALVRRLIKQLRDERGHARVQSITRLEGGQPVKVYKQEELFDVDDYRQVCSYYGGRADYFRGEFDGLRARCLQRYGVDPALPAEPVALRAP